MNHRRTVAALAALVTAAGLAGCGGAPEERIASVPVSGDPYPLVAVPQARGILESVDAAVAAGAKARTREAYGNRISGPYRELAIVRDRADAARRAPVAAPVDAERIRLLVPSGQAWPRFFVAVGTKRGEPTPLLQVLSSPNARTPYGLWGELNMLPGATLPDVAAPAEGAPALSPDDASLAASPKQVLAQYAAFLTKGANSPEARLFAPSAYSDQIFAWTVAQRQEQARGRVATASSTHSVSPENVYALRTKDGGALVLGALRQRYTITVRRGAGKIRVDDPVLVALAGNKKEFSTAFNRISVEILAFRVPPRGKGPVTVVAAQKGDVAAEVK